MPVELVPEESLPPLTIIKKGLLRITTEEWRSLENVFHCLRGTALALLLAPDGVEVSAKTKRAVLLFDRLLSVLNEPEISSALVFATPRFRTLQISFYGAMGSERFLEGSAASRLAYAYTFGSLMKRLRLVTDVLLADHNQTATAAIPVEFIDAFERLPFDQAKVRALQPYLLEDKDGVKYNVSLGPMVGLFGGTFTNSFFEGLCKIARARAKHSNLRDFGTTFAEFAGYQASIGKAISVSMLVDPNSVQDIVVDFMEYHFMKMRRRKQLVQEGTLGSLQKQWTRYKDFWRLLFKQGTLAWPKYAFPDGNPRLLSHSSIGHLKEQKRESGDKILLTGKLITPVPLHITDEEATKLVFKQVSRDFVTVQSWLRAHLNSFLDDYRLGGLMAAQVNMLPTLPDELTRLTERFKEATGLPLAIKYFRDIHGGYCDTSRVKTAVYPDCVARERISKAKLARLLGIPSRREAMALMGFLASHDGRFSESALSVARLTDNKGTRINAVETDAGLTLSVLKTRNAADGWHDVILNEEAAEMVRQWIIVTAPLRAKMQKDGVTGWQNLIIYTGQPLGAPGCFLRSTNINSTFRNFALSAASVLGPLAHLVTIPKIRSTRGVIVFLETMDIKRMSKELGNNTETSLRHYLPDALWEYFTTRWIRIFQNLLIVEATRNTSYMARALHFESAAEMDRFLLNHAITPLIPNEELTEEASSNPGSREPRLSEMMVAASPEIFTVLVSIAAASAQADANAREITPQALYWTEFTNRIRKYIESNEFHDRGIKKMMSAAAKNAKPADYMGVVCA